MKARHAHWRGRARDLRAQGLAIRVIAERLGVPASTVADMVRGVHCITDGVCEVCGQAYTFDRTLGRMPRHCGREMCARVSRNRVLYNRPSRRGEYTRQARGL